MAHGTIGRTLRDPAIPRPAPVHASVRGTGSAALLCALATEHGLARRQLLAGTGIDEAALDDPTAVITAEQEVRLIAALTAALPPETGLSAGVRYRLTTYGIWGFALLSSRTLLESHEVAMRFVDLTYALTRISARRDDGELVLLFDDLSFDDVFPDHPSPDHPFGDDPQLPEAVRRFVLLRDAGAAVQLWREALGRPVAPLRVSLRLPEPADAAPYEAVFGVRPEFGAARSALAFDAGLLDEPLPQADPLTLAVCVSQCRDLLERRQSRRGTSGRVRDLLLRDPGRMPGQEQVAASLDMSVRTLRRRLEEEGTSFRSVVEQTRELLADALLTTAGLNVAQVATRLGYAEASSFVHAFRRWKGASPGRWAQERAPETSAAGPRPERGRPRSTLQH